MYIKTWEKAIWFSLCPPHFSKCSGRHGCNFLEHLSCDEIHSPLVLWNITTGLEYLVQGFFSCRVSPYSLNHLTLNLNFQNSVTRIIFFFPIRNFYLQAKNADALCHHPPPWVGAHKEASRVEQVKTHCGGTLSNGWCKWEQRPPISPPAFSREIVGVFLHNRAQGHCLFLRSLQQSGRRKMSLKRQINLPPHCTTPQAICKTRNRSSSSCIYLLSHWTMSSLMGSPSSLLSIEDLIYCSSVADVFKQPCFLFEFHILKEGTD